VLFLAPKHEETQTNHRMRPTRPRAAKDTGTAAWRSGDREDSANGVTLRGSSAETL
jgi:hypothetical protein